MKITKKIVRKSAEFLNTIPDDQWTKGSQERMDGTRCAIGHLALNPKSPLYDPFYVRDGFVKSVDFESPVISLNQLCERKTRIYLSEANNNPKSADAATPRDGSVKLLNFLAEIL